MNETTPINKEKYLQEIGSNVRSYRQKLEMTTKDLGEAINHDAAFVEQLESGFIDPWMSDLIRIARVLDVTVRDICITNEVE